MMTTTKIKLFPKQLDFYRIRAREALLEAGIGYGKSRVASLWLANCTQKYPGTNWIMAARDYRQLKTSVDREFEYYLHDIFKLQRDIDYRKINGSPIEYQFIRTGSKIFGFGAQNYDTAFRAGNYNGAWGDEVDFWKPEAVKALRGRIRVAPEMIRWTSSPYGFNHIYEDFYINQIGPVINATSYENPTLSQEYFENLRASYDERMFRQEVLAERLNITQGRIYYAFDRDKHVQEIEYDPQYPLWAGVDFNVDPMTATIGQIKPVRCADGKIRQVLHCIDEVYLRDSNTPALCAAILSRYGANVTIVPDSTGNKRGTTSSTNITDIQILRQHFKKISPGLNPYRVDRYAAVNGAFHNDLVLISTRCENLIKDLESVTYREGTDQPDISQNKLLTHCSDNMGYLIYKTVNPLRTGVKKVSSQPR